MNELDIDLQFDFEKDLRLEPVQLPHPHRHAVVCRYWLDGLCVRGKECDYLHRMDPEKIQMCKYGMDCKLRPNCPYRHVSDEEKEVCVNYLLGFCKFGPNCRYRHIPREPEALPEISSVFIPGAMEQYRSVKPKKGFHREKQEGMWLDGLEGTADTYKAMVLGPDYEEREANAALESQSELLMSLTFQLSSLSDSMLERDGRVEELGLPDDPIFSKYFFLRSATYNNIALSVAEPWPIPPALGMEMSRFLQGMGQRVFVFVSVMNSATIQGVAEVVSVTNEPQPVTLSDGSSGPPMARANMRWHRLTMLPFSSVTDLRNPLRPPAGAASTDQLPAPLLVRTPSWAEIHPTVAAVLMLRLYKLAPRNVKAEDQSIVDAKSWDLRQPTSSLEVPFVTSKLATTTLRAAPQAVALLATILTLMATGEDIGTETAQAEDAMLQKTEFTLDDLQGVRGGGEEAQAALQRFVEKHIDTGRYEAPSSEQQPLEQMDDHAKLVEIAITAWAKQDGFMFGCNSNNFKACMAHGVFAAKKTLEVSMDFIEPGTPLLLTQFTDRVVMGLFMAASKAVENLSPGFSQLNPLYPVHVRVRPVLMCPPLAETEYKDVYHPHIGRLPQHVMVDIGRRLLRKVAPMMLQQLVRTIPPGDIQAACAKTGISLPASMQMPPMGALGAMGAAGGHGMPGQGGPPGSMPMGGPPGGMPPHAMNPHMMQQQQQQQQQFHDAQQSGDGAMAQRPRMPPPFRPPHPQFQQQFQQQGYPQHMQMPPHMQRFQQQQAMQGGDMNAPGRYTQSAGQGGQGEGQSEQEQRALERERQLQEVMRLRDEGGDRGASRSSHRSREYDSRSRASESRGRPAPSESRGRSRETERSRHTGRGRSADRDRERDSRRGDERGRDRSESGRDRSDRYRERGRDASGGRDRDRGSNRDRERSSRYGDRDRERDGRRGRERSRERDSSSRPRSPRRSRSRGRR